MTKVQEQRKARYLKQLRKCGFRSWKRANARRFELIITLRLQDSQRRELAALNHLAGLFQTYRTNDMLGRSMRRAKRLETRLNRS